MRTSALLRVVLAGTALWLGGCAVSRQAYDASDAAVATVGPAEIRTWADVPSDPFDREIRRQLRRSRTPPVYLALSGGGGDGAYGAGLLNGWTRSGKRPEFTIVSGVSTGALIAPFAFLGSGYDATLTELYTSGVAETLLQSPNLIQALVGSSIFSNDQLNRLVAQYVTPEVLEAVAREGESGRVLLILTTNLDSQRPVLWNLTAVARQRTPEALALFRTVLVASASIPAVFPPVLIGADGNGRHFEELHVDGSISSNVFTLPRSYLLGGDAGRPGIPGGKLYILLNTTLLPDFRVIEDRTTSIVARTISTSNKEETRTDLALVHEAARRERFDFNLTFIDRPEAGNDAFGFDTATMRRLYAFGERRGLTGTFWRKSPPPLGESTARVAGR